MAASLAAGALVFEFHAPAEAQVGAAAAGRRLAQEWCSDCHAIGADPRAGSMSLGSIARLPTTTQFSLRAFLLSPHPTMPNFRLSPQQIDDVVAYILSLQGR